MTTITIPTPPGYRYLPTIWSHGWYQLAPFRFDEGARTLERIHELADGSVVNLKIAPQEEDRQLAVSVEGLSSALTDSQRAEIARAASRILGLDQDLRPFYDAIRGKPDYAWVEQSGAGRIMVSPAVWEDLAKTLMTTNTTWNMTKAMVRRLCALGKLYPGEAEAFAFPRPQTIAAMSVDELNEKVRAGYRGAYLHELAARIASGLDVEAWYGNGASGAELYKRVRSIKGFGDYATGAALRLMQRHDWLSIDTACRAMFKERTSDGQAPSDADIRAYYEPFGEWRGLAQWMDLLKVWFMAEIQKQQGLK